MLRRDPAPEEKTLMSKWKEHYENRQFTPKQEEANTYGVLFFWGFTISLMYSSLWVIVPAVYKEEDTERTAMRVLIWLIFFESVLNWILCVGKKLHVAKKDKLEEIRTNTGIRSDFAKEWKHCFSCQMDIPPRAHHCKVCNACVLKRDHHCFFTGTCIGYDNQRHFIVLTFYLAVGSLCAIYLTLSYLWTVVGPLPDNPWAYFPLTALYYVIRGTHAWTALFIVLQLYCAAGTLVAGVSFCYWQMLVVSRGQTSHEFLRNIGRFRLSLGRNFQSVFGPLWPLNFVFPIPVQCYADGVNWRLRSKVT